MSEFSESYHLRSERAEDAVELLRRAGHKGYVYQPTNGWVTFLADEGDFEPDERIVAAAKHPLLHYVSAEDHGWSFEMFERGEIISGYRCDWDDEIRVDDSKYSRDALLRVAPSAQLEEFEQHLQPDDLDEMIEAEPSNVFAHGLGLEHYEWLSYDYVAADYGESPEDYPEVTEVI
jgi:hypothetical protein